MNSIRLWLTFGQEATPGLLAEFFEIAELDREIILGGQAVDGIETITSYVVGSRAAYESYISDREDVLEWEITPGENGFYTFLRRELGSEGVSLLDSLSQRTVVVIPPIEIRSDRTVRLTLVGHPEDLQTVLDELPDDSTLDIRAIHDGIVTTPTSISTRQRKALRVAWECGYYDIPRQNGIETVADELDCVVSTASELLRRAEAQLVAATVRSE